MKTQVTQAEFKVHHMSVGRPPTIQLKDPDVLK